MCIVGLRDKPRLVVLLAVKLYPRKVFSYHIDGVQQPRENWIDIPFPLDLLEGETKHDFCKRLRPAFKDMNDDQVR